MTADPDSTRPPTPHADAKHLAVLLLEDSDFDAELIGLSIERHGYRPEITRARDEGEFRSGLGRQRYDLVISDYSLPQFDAHQAIALAQAQGSEAPIIVVTGTLDDEAAVRCIKGGASDYLLKDRLARLGPAVDRALDERRLRLEQTKLADRERRQSERLNALRLIDIAITGSLDVNVTLTVLLDQIATILDVHAAAVLLFDRHSHELRFAQGRGFQSGSSVEATAIALGDGIAGRVAQERRMIHIPDLAQEPRFARTALVTQEGFVGYYGVPLIAKGSTKGVLELFHREPFDKNADWVEFLSALAAPAAIAVDNAQLFDDMQRANAELELAYDRTLEGWARTLELRDYETKGHSERVVGLSRAIGRAVGFDGEMLADLKRGALLHDIGKIAIPDPVLLKPGKLTDDEWAIMRKHPEYGYKLLSHIPFLAEAVRVAYSHHEKWDGSGYPLGLEGEQIPILARAFSIADVYDALRSERPYKQPWSRTDARDYILDQSGTHFDPAMVTAFAGLSQDHLA